MFETLDNAHVGLVVRVQIWNGPRDVQTSYVLHGNHLGFQLQVQNRLQCWQFQPRLSFAVLLPRVWCPFAFWDHSHKTGIRFCVFLISNIQFLFFFSELISALLSRAKTSWFSPNLRKQKSAAWMFYLQQRVNKELVSYLHFVGTVRMLWPGRHL